MTHPDTVYKGANDEKNHREPYEARYYAQRLVSKASRDPPNGAVPKTLRKEKYAKNAQTNCKAKQKEWPVQRKASDAIFNCITCIGCAI